MAEIVNNRNLSKHVTAKSLAVYKKTDNNIANSEELELE
jgi:hypothetical protein